MWAFEDDFAGDRFLLDCFDSAFQGGGVTFSPYTTDPDEVWEVFDPREWFDFPEGWQLEDPEPDCSHEFEDKGGDNKCIRCGTLYQRHFETQLPLYAENEGVRAYRKEIHVSGEDSTLEPDGHPHVHNWSANSFDEDNRRYECQDFMCEAKKVVGRSEVLVKYTHEPVGELETRRVRNCDHKWKDQGLGQECWKCGKTRPASDKPEW